MSGTLSEGRSGIVGDGYGGKGRRWWALAACCFGLFMALLDITVVNVALPVIQEDLGVGFSDLQWIISAYTIAIAVLLVTAGRLGDIFGRKRMFLLGLSVFTVGSLLCALSGGIAFGGLSHIQLLWGARAIQGLGGSVMLPVSLAIISATFTGRERGMAIGIWGGVAGLATAIGPVVGGVLVAKASWESIFYLNLPIGVAGIMLSAWAIRESRDEGVPRTVDLFGLVTITASVFCLVLALIQGEGKGWGSAYILTLLAVAAAALISFVVGELRIKNPMVDPRLFKNRSFTGAAITAFALNAGLYSLFFFLTLYFQNFLGFNALGTGLRLLPFSALILFTAPLAGVLTGRVGARPVLFWGMVMLVFSVLLMTLISPQNTQADWIVLLPAFIVGGLGNGLVNPPISTVAVSTVSQGRAGMASGVSNVCRQVGITFGIAFLGALLTSRYNDHIHDKVLALNSSYLGGPARNDIISGVQQAGTIAGSRGLAGNSNPFQDSPLYPAIQQIARSSFVDGTTFILYVAAAILALGALSALFLIRKSDMIQDPHEARPEEARAEKANDR